MSAVRPRSSRHEMMSLLHCSTLPSVSNAAVPFFIGVLATTIKTTCNAASSSVQVFIAAVFPATLARLVLIVILLNLLIVIVTTFVGAIAVADYATTYAFAVVYRRAFVAALDADVVAASGIVNVVAVDDHRSNGGGRSSRGRNSRAPAWELHPSNSPKGWVPLAPSSRFSLLRFLYPW